MSLWGVSKDLPGWWCAPLVGMTLLLTQGAGTHTMNADIRGGLAGSDPGGAGLISFYSQDLRMLWRGQQRGDGTHQSWKGPWASLGLEIHISCVTVSLNENENGTPLEETK